MKLLRSVVAVALLAAAGASQAAVQAWGPHAELETAFQMPVAGVIDDVYTFSLAEDTINDLTASAVSLKNRDFLNIIGGKVDLYFGTFGDAAADEWKGGFDFSTNTGANQYLIEGLLAGNYYYTVTGEAVGSYGGMYQFSSSLVTAPVPEPETYAMLAAGLGAIVVARRAKKA